MQIECVLRANGSPEVQSGDSALRKDVFSHSHDVLIMGAGAGGYERQPLRSSVDIS